MNRRDFIRLVGLSGAGIFLLAPIGVQSIIHPQGELATARACRETATPLIASTVSSYPLEQIAETLGETPRWFQLYWPADDALAASLIQRAEKAGYSAIVVTLDTFLMAWRERDIQHAYLPFLHGDGLANYVTDPVFRAGLPAPPEEDPEAAFLHFARVFSDPGRTWKDLESLRQKTKLPIVLKGILHPEDARLAVDHGADAIVVSNHGGRQVDGAVASIEALPEVVNEIGDDIPVLFDSGIRRGADAVKALSLGARAVLLGRSYAYGLAVGGAEGVADVIRNFHADLDLTLGLTGYRSVSELDSRSLRGV